MNMTKLSDTRTLSNGCGIPCVGFGTFLIPNGAPTAAAVKAAVDAGYRLIDTGFIYENEAAVGEGIRAALAGGEHCPRRPLRDRKSLEHRARL